LDEEDVSSDDEVPKDVVAEDESSSNDDDGDDDDDAEEVLAARPYAALLQSLIVDAAPQAKRRKLESFVENDVHEERLGDALVLRSEQGVDRVENEGGGEGEGEEEEEEEGPEAEVDGAFEEDEHETEDISDPFEVHFANPDDNILSRRLKALEKHLWSIQKISLPMVGKAVVCIPDDTKSSLPVIPMAITSPAGLKLKQKLAISLTKQSTTFDSWEQNFAPYLFNYNDILFCERNLANSDRLRRLTCLHAVNHIFKYDLALQLLLSFAYWL